MTTSALRTTGVLRMGVAGLAIALFADVDRVHADATVAAPKAAAIATTSTIGPPPSVVSSTVYDAAAETDSTESNTGPRRLADILAQASEPTAPKDENTTTDAKALPPPAHAPPSTGYYREPGTYGTKRETVPPGYVRTLNKTGIAAFSDINWLDVGLDHRMRYEYREDDFRRPRATTDNLFLLKTRAYVGLHDIIDPLRFTFELQDSRAENGKFAKDNRDYNEFEPIQMIAELYFKDVLPKDPLGQSRPISLRGGRMWFEKIDRRLIGNNQWRNTTNTFQGLHLDIGQEVNDWELEAIITQPLDRKKYDFDRINTGQWFYAIIGHWRRWSDIVTIEPYYLFLDQQQHGGRAKRHIHAPAIRLYGPIGKTAFNYDINLVYQTGKDTGQDQQAFGAATELGYTFTHPWKPRASIFYGYGSGDDSPNDNKMERFERFYGFGRPWSANDYFVWENFHAPKTRIELVPIKDLRFDASYSWYWLASDTDRWVNANLRDPTGKSGDFIGHEFDFRFRYPLLSRVDASFGYAHFQPGGFTKKVGRDNASDFFYIELTTNIFARN